MSEKCFIYGKNSSPTSISPFCKPEGGWEEVGMVGKKGDSIINIIDTTGKRDFAAEVERVLHMADGALLLIKAFLFSTFKFD